MQMEERQGGSRVSLRQGHRWLLLIQQLLIAAAEYVLVGFTLM